MLSMIASARRCRCVKVAARKSLGAADDPCAMRRRSEAKQIVDSRQFFTSGFNSSGRTPDNSANLSENS